jgi:adenosylmethionine-8-amino-7-oxononanoate aminotransferase
VALKNLDKLDALIASGQLSRTIQRFGRILAEQLAGHPNVAAIRQRGLAASIELAPASGHPPWPADARMGWQVCLAARKHELILRPLGESLLIVPPLIISDSELEFLCQRIQRTLDEVCSSIKQPCKFCKSPTSETVAGDAICLDCYSLQGACCQGDD